MNAQLVIRNVGGATGTIGTAEVVRSRPDGTTLLLTSMSAVAIQPSYRANPPYRAENLVPVCLVAGAPARLMTPKATGLRTVADLVALARANPGQVPYASGGVRGLGHLAMVGLTRGLWGEDEPHPLPRLRGRRAGDAAGHGADPDRRGEPGQP